MAEERIEALLDSMTLEEQVALLAGADFWSTVPIERVGIPAVKVTDGPNGARGGGALIGGVTAASFPVGISLGSTWDTELVNEIGQALAEEAQSKGARVLLAPTVNIHRSTRNGRNFECYSEDPFLTAKLAVSYIKGLQSKGIAATIKHYAGNESEFERMTISSEIGERPLREIYLLPFEAAVKEAKTWAVMSAYNKVNGVYASENHYLLTEILRDQWGFDGVVMSDWFGSHSTAPTVNAGLDLEMPGPTRDRGEKLVAAVKAGEVSPETVRESARRILRLFERIGALDDPTIAPEQAIDKPEHRALIRRAGAEGSVLLKNNGVLPLDKGKIETIAMIGPNAQTAQIMGGGSAQVNAHYRISPYEGVLAQAGDSVELSFAQGATNNKQLPVFTGGFDVEYYNSNDLSGPVIYRTTAPKSEFMWMAEIGPGVRRDIFSARITGSYKASESGEYLFSLTSAGLSRLYVDGKLLIENWENWKPGESYFGAGSDQIVRPLELQAGQTYTITIEYSFTIGTTLPLAALHAGVMLPLGDKAIEDAVALAKQSDVAVLFVGLTGEWDTEGVDRPHIRLVGRQDELIARVAAANPKTVVVLQTGAPVEMPWLNDVAAVLQAWYPGQEAGNAIADVLFGEVNPSGRLPQTFPVRLEDDPTYINYPGENGKVFYGEGLFVGYRYYDTKKIEPLFPFGFGLSYTTFAYSNLRLSADTIGPNDTLTVTLDVTNTGQRAGKSVVQLYVRDPQSRLVRPEKELKGFTKVALEAGETRTVSIQLDPRSFAYYDDAKAAWVVEAGSFEILVGESSRHIHLRAEVSMTETREIQP
jgi:Beta-glucosidase-related glycosidases